MADHQPNPKAFPTMRHSRSSRHAAPTVTPLLDYLPGLTPSDDGTAPPDHQLDTPHSGWWVRRGAHQSLDLTGQPVGYRHQLMHGHRIIKSGIGADCARTFREQAAFLNARDQRPLRPAGTHTDEPSDPQPQTPHD